MATVGLVTKRKIPEPLLDLMKQGWAEPPTDAGPAVAAEHAARREALRAAFPGETLVIPTGNPVTRSNDTEFDFRPSSDFAYLTGYYAPDAVLILGAAESDEPVVLYLRPRADRTSHEFFTSYHGELWTGPRPTLAAEQARLGLACADLADLPKALEALNPATTRVLRGFDKAVDAAVEADEPPPPPADTETEGGEPAEPKEPTLSRDQELARALSDARLVKDDWEIAQLRDAIGATVRGFEDVARALPADRESSERLVEGVFGLRARHDGNWVGYGTIAAAGPHACTLHWTANHGVCRPGELLLLDAGVENVHFYTADITRTLPISGRFSPEQRRVYDIVHAAQLAGFAAIKPGVTWRDVELACTTVLAEGLAELGILPTTPEVALDKDNQTHRRWTLHSFGHMLGIDVHDCAAARAEVYRDGGLAEGYVLTVEPGLYFQPDDELVPPEYRGIGVRIEDNVLVTAEGCEVLSAALPTRADEVEAWMATLRGEAGSGASYRLPGDIN